MMIVRPYVDPGLEEYLRSYLLKYLIPVYKYLGISKNISIQITKLNASPDVKPYVLGRYNEKFNLVKLDTRAITKSYDLFKQNRWGASMLMTIQTLSHELRHAWQNEFTGHALAIENYSFATEYDERIHEKDARLFGTLVAEEYQRMFNERVAKRVNIYCTLSMDTLWAIDTMVREEIGL